MARRGMKLGAALVALTFVVAAPASAISPKKVKSGRYAGKIGPDPVSGAPVLGEISWRLRQGQTASPKIERGDFAIRLYVDPPCTPPYAWTPSNPPPTEGRGYFQFSSTEDMEVVAKGVLFPYAVIARGAYPLGIREAVITPRGKYVKKKKAKGQMILESGDFTYAFDDYNCSYSVIANWTAKRVKKR